MGQAGTNFHSLPPNYLTIYLIMLNVPVNYLKLLYNSIVDTDFYLIIINNLAFVIWTHI